MAVGIMEVRLVGAGGLKNNEFLGGGIDPYVVLQYKSQECKSKVARGQGGSPVWNEKFTFRVEYPGGGDSHSHSHSQYKLILSLMDEDTFSSDDFLGQATIYLEELLALGVEKGNAELHPRKYSVVSSNKSYCGEIQVGIKFTPKMQDEGGNEFGGWKESDY